MKYLQALSRMASQKAAQRFALRPGKGRHHGCRDADCSRHRLHRSGCRIRRNTGAHGCPQPFNVHERADADRDKHPQHLRRAQ